MPCGRREAERAAGIGADVGARLIIVQAYMRVATTTSRGLEGLGHERRPQPVPLRDALDEVFEESMAVGRGEGVVKVPVDFELAVGLRSGR